MIEADFVIVGAGSAGCVLAHRLSERSDHSVVVLEAGGGDRRPSIQVPIGYGMTYFDRSVNWKYQTEPVPSLGGRTSYWPRGKVLGGSSAINAMVYVRGHPGDFERWGEAARGWSWRDVEPYFRRMEDWIGPPDPRRGVGGPLAVSEVSSEVHPLCATYLDAARQSGLAFNADYNAGCMHGASIYQLTLRAGRRASAARCYLHPALTRRNVRAITRAMAVRLLWRGTRAVGVEFRHGGTTRRVLARREVIVSAGAINSPQLLQLSGVGPGPLLQSLGIPVVRDSPAVGRNLQDHLGVDHHYRCNVATLNEQLRPWSGRIKVALRYLMARRGPLSLSVNHAGGFMRLDGESGPPDIQLYFTPVSYTRGSPGKRALMRPDPFPGLLLGFSACRPTSRGYLQIRSANAYDAPEIHPNYLDTEHDRRQILAGSRVMCRFAQMPALAEIIEAPVLPLCASPDDDALMDHVRDHAWTVFHPNGTCRMGRSDVDDVVDARLRVHGVAGLRVVDASVFPSITSGNTNAPTIMLAERAADLILGDANSSDALPGAEMP